MTLNLQNVLVDGVGLITLAEAARSVGGHAETLRVCAERWLPCRDPPCLRGALAAMSRPAVSGSATAGFAPSGTAHGAYYVDLRDFAHFLKPRRGWPEPREVTASQLEESWDLVEGTLGPARAWRDR